MDPKIMPIGDLCQKVEDVLNIVHEQDNAIYLTQHGQPVAVLVDYARYEELLNKLQQLTGGLPEDLSKTPVNGYTASMAGLYREVWEGVDTDAYLREERDSWDNSKES